MFSCCISLLDHDVRLVAIINTGSLNTVDAPRSAWQVCARMLLRLVDDDPYLGGHAWTAAREWTMSKRQFENCSSSGSREQQVNRA
eukprot:3093451-Amphidinium_carterae.1